MHALRLGLAGAGCPQPLGRESPWGPGPFPHPQMTTQSWGGTGAAGWGWLPPWWLRGWGWAWKLLVLGGVYSSLDFFLNKKALNE